MKYYNDNEPVIYEHEHIATFRHQIRELSIQIDFLKERVLEKGFIQAYNALVRAQAELYKAHESITLQKKESKE
jgi:hypothetical protein